MEGKSLLKFKAVGFYLLFKRLTVRVVTFCGTGVLQFLELWHHICDLKNNTESLLKHLISCLSIQYVTAPSQLVMPSLFIYDH